MIWPFSRNGHNKLDAQLLESRTRLQEAAKRRELEQNAHRLQALESVALPNWIGDYSDFMGAQADNWLPVGAGSRDRKDGSNYPFFNSLKQLGFLRELARLVVGQNPFAGGMLEGLTSFVIGEGITWTADSRQPIEDNTPDADIRKQEVRRVQSVLDDWMQGQGWWKVEREAFRRSRRDGEFFLRWFDGECRFVEPEQVQEPDGTPDWRYGVRTADGDVVKPLAYWVVYDGQAVAEGEEVPTEDLLHYKANVDSTIKRGMPDFAFGTREIIEGAYKLIRNMSEGSAIQAAIAEIQQFESATQTQVQGFADEQASFTRSNPFTNRTENIEKINPGTIRRVPKGTTYVPPPYSQGIPAHTTVFEACLRTAASRWNAPEWLISSNATNMGAYTSSLVAESPFVKRCTAEQKDYVSTFRQIVMKVIRKAIAENRLPPDVLDRVEIKGVAPRVEARNKAEQAQTDQIYIQAGVKSVQTAQQELGLDVEQEAVNREEYKQRFGDQGGMLPTDDPGPEPAPVAEAVAAKHRELRESYGDDVASAVIRATAKLLEDV